MTVGDIEARMSGRELTEWQVVFRREARFHELVDGGLSKESAHRVTWEPRHYG